MAHKADRQDSPRLMVLRTGVKLSNGTGLEAQQSVRVDQPAPAIARTCSTTAYLRMTT